MKLKLSTKIGLYMGLIILAVVVSVGVVALRFGGNMMMTAEEKSIETLAESSAAQVEAEISKRLDLLSETANNDYVKSMSWALQRRALADDVERYGYLDMAVVTVSLAELAQSLRNEISKFRY